MNKTILGVAMVVVFCISWWKVAGKALQTYEKSQRRYTRRYLPVEQEHYLILEQTFEHSTQAVKRAREVCDAEIQVCKQAKQALEACKPEEQVFKQAEQALEQAKQAFERAYDQAYKEAKQSLEARNPKKSMDKQKVQAYEQATEAFQTARAQWRRQALRGLRAGLVADVLLLVGALAWSKLTAKA